MERLNILVEICNAFKKGAFSIEEFQSRIITACIPEKVSKSFLNSLVEFDNEIEKILFCINHQSQFSKACETADSLVDAVKNEQKKYK